MEEHHYQLIGLIGFILAGLVFVVVGSVVWIVACLVWLIPVLGRK